LAGVAARPQICFQVPNSFFDLLAADFDGAIAPPAGATNPVVTLDPGLSNFPPVFALDVFRFHADFVTPANSTLSGPTVVPVSAFSPAFCTVAGPDGGTVETSDCIPQPGTAARLDTLGF